ncbi:peptidase C12, ubiquitin carboxyl-terminal hydrolase 1 [Pluteus cervinus]|uniref:Peptidase C12, ubiquitin carboxyl-terminal hydrolase 1 n=1 Tax=Pluteus cervinus TaxID=181527 RepID=A0ACD3AJ64_9AGAR|nr:peptidase C12, ubiquitin carboxyl-terminal hydrolase 1 [Pluteus cervinus]
MTTEGKVDNRWIPLESNPEVFNKWSKQAGLNVSQERFGDIYGLDDDLLAMVPQPVIAVILLFPVSEPLAKARKEEDEQIAKDGQPKIDPTILWIKQTIGNACGTMGLIHTLANSGATLTPASPIAKFIAECQDKTPQERAKLLETTPLFASIHAETASGGQTAVPTNLDTDLHFTCFVTAPEAEFRERAKKVTSGEVVETPPVEGEAAQGTGMRLVELDGDRNGPIDRGEITDFLKDVAKVVKEKYLPHSSSMQFSMLALAPPEFGIIASS